MMLRARASSTELPLHHASRLKWGYKNLFSEIAEQIQRPMSPLRFSPTALSIVFSVELRRAAAIVVACGGETTQGALG
jgi:hypothetical protein